MNHTYCLNSWYLYHCTPSNDNKKFQLSVNSLFIFYSKLSLGFFSSCSFPIFLLIPVLSNLDYNSGDNDTVSFV